MELAIFWVVFSVFIGIGAAGRGRNGLGWFLLSMLVSPLLAFLLLLLLPSIAQAEGVPSPETHVRCPDCRELVLKDARKCKHCGCRLIPQGDQIA